LQEKTLIVFFCSPDTVGDMKTQSLPAIFLVVLSLFAAAASAQDGVHPDRIVVGQTAAFSGGLGPIVKELTAGAQAYFDMVNAQGGVHGRKVVMESLDDALDAKRTVANTRLLVDEKKVFCLFLYRGTPQVEAVLPLLNELKVPLIGPSTGALTMFLPPKRYLFPVRASYGSEVEEAVNHLVTTGTTRIALIRDDSSFGQDGHSAFEAAMKKRGIAPHAIAVFPRGSTQVDEAVKKLAAAQAQAALIVASPNSAAAIVKRMRATGEDMLLLALSNVSSDSFVKDIGESGRGVIVAQVTPAPGGARAQASRELQKVVKGGAKAPISYSALEGFIAAKVLVEGLRRAGPKPTREKLVAALEGMQRYDAGDIDVSYGPDSRTGSRYVELTIIGRNGNFIR
jgi:branched-chain amino acid transport system substrate-binding protein